MLAGESMRSLAKRIDPPVNHVSLCRFRLKLIAPAVDTLKGKAGESRRISDIAALSGVSGDVTESTNRAKDLLKQELQNSISARKSRRERWISEAEKRPIVSPETGEIVGNMMDHKALAAHDRNEGSDIEFTARLSGLLQDSSTGAATIRAVVMMPSPGDPAAAQPAEPGRLAVEIDLKR
jgi:hypothetical protein